MTPDEIKQQPFFHIPFWLAPDNELFARRARRLAHLAELTQVEDANWRQYLQLLVQVCLVQQDLYQTLPLATLPVSNDEFPLTIHLIDQYAQQWPRLLTDMHQQLASKLLPTGQRVWQELLALSAQQLLALLKRGWQQTYTLAEQDYSIWINALLQIAYTRMAHELNQSQIKTSAESGFCPCCGQDAVGAVIIGQGELAGLRYLHCDLCNSRWHSVRARCSFCDHDHDLGAYRIENTDNKVLAAAEAECCPQCHGYRKRYMLEKQQDADPVADDLVTLALDVLLGQENWQRGGFNRFLIREKPFSH